MSLTVLDNTDPEGIDAAALRPALEKLADELMIDLNLDDPLDA